MRFDVNVGRQGADIHFGSIDELIGFCERPLAHQHGYRESRSGDRNFTLTSTWAEAVELATKGGWKRGEDATARYLSLTVNRLGSMIERAKYSFDVEGQDFDVQRVLAGEPEVWMQEHSVMVDGPSRIIRVTVNTSYSCGIDTSVVIARGAVAAALVQLLELAGHSVELTALTNTSCIGGPFNMAVDIKRAGQPLCVPEMVFALAHPSYLRRLGFAMKEHAGRDFAAGGYGMPTHTPEELRGDVHLDRMMFGELDWLSPRAAEKWMLEQLEAQGVPLGEPSGAALPDDPIVQGGLPGMPPAPRFPRYRPRRRRRW